MLKFASFKRPACSTASLWRVEIGTIIFHIKKLEFVHLCWNSKPIIWKCKLVIQKNCIYSFCIHNALAHRGLNESQIPTNKCAVPRLDDFSHQNNCTILPVIDIECQIDWRCKSNDVITNRSIRSIESKTAQKKIKTSESFMWWSQLIENSNAWSALITFRFSFSAEFFDRAP